jgi:hypothetical protein
MKITKLLVAICLFIPFLSSCLNDVSEIDTRAAISIPWKVTDNYDNTGGLGYTVTISADANESTRVLFDNFGNFRTSDKVYATLADKKLNIPSQTPDGGPYTIEGTGTIANDLKSISFTYTVTDKDGTTPVNAEYGQNFTKKKSVKIVQ